MMIFNKVNLLDNSEVWQIELNIHDHALNR